MGEGWPKPEPKVREPRKLTRKAAMKARTKRTVGRPKYLRKEWRDLRAKVLYRAKGECEHQGPTCAGEATEVHHLSRNRGRGVKSLLVPMDQLQAVCHACHKAQEAWLDSGFGLGSREKNAKRRAA